MYINIGIIVPDISCILIKYVQYNILSVETRLHFITQVLYNMYIFYAVRGILN